MPSLLGTSCRPQKCERLLNKNVPYMILVEWNGLPWRLVLFAFSLHWNFLASYPNACMDIEKGYGRVVVIGSMILGDHRIHIGTAWSEYGMVACGNQIPGVFHEVNDAGRDLFLCYSFGPGRQRLSSSYRAWLKSYLQGGIGSAHWAQ